MSVAEELITVPRDPSNLPMRLRDTLMTRAGLLPADVVVVRDSVVEIVLHPDAQLIRFSVEQAGAPPRELVSMSFTHRLADSFHQRATA